MNATLEDLHTHTRLRPFDWRPRKFFSFLMANSKGRFPLWVVSMLPTIQMMNLFGNADLFSLLFAPADNAAAGQFTVCMPAARYFSWCRYSDKVRQLSVLSEARL